MSVSQDYVYALAASPAFRQDGLCFAARQSGLYRSTDGGETWQPAYAQLRLAGPLTTLAVALSPAFPADGTVSAGVAGGVLRSCDRGATWEAILLPAPPPTVSCLAVSPAYEEDGQVFAGTLEDGVFRSADRGRSWHAWNFGLLDLCCLALAVSPGFVADEMLLVGTETGLYRSTNGGRAWREVEPLAEAAPILSLALGPGPNPVIFVGTDASGLWRSADGGRTWQVLGQAVLAGAINGVLLSPHYPAQPDILALRDDMAWLSRNDGRSWSPLPTQEISAIAAPEGLSPDAQVLIGGLDGRVARTTLP
ncbi:MAG: WD40/YVTN/BNR-like repeat-containing protein [Anaerolineae bacterium]